MSVIKRVRTGGVIAGALAGATLSGPVAPTALATITPQVSANRSGTAYRDGARIDNNAIGIVFHPRGDYFDVWYNRYVLPNRTKDLVFIEA
jgi:hypothetical protein